MKKLLIIIIFAFLCPQLAHAHQPHIVTGSDTTAVQNPEVSQAFYGKLDGKPHTFAISSSSQLDLYVSLLIPVAPGAADNISATITDASGKTIADIDGVNAPWKNFYEPFAGDDYKQGPEFEKQVQASDYSVKIHNTDNTGKYVVAIGKIESFPLSEIMHTIKTLPHLKTDFFGKSVFSAYFNYTGLFMLGMIIIIGVVFLVGIWIIKKLRHKM
jgi:hypothetical protein